MKNDFPDYIRDMNHDGEIDGQDFALFHEMLDEDQKEEPVRRSSSSSDSSEPWTIHHSVVKGFLLLLFGGYLALLLKGLLPINGFTAVLALVSAVCFLRVLLL